MDFIDEIVIGILIVRNARITGKILGVQMNALGAEPGDGCREAMIGVPVPDQPGREHDQYGRENPEHGLAEGSAEEQAGAAVHGGSEVMRDDVGV